MRRSAVLALVLLGLSIATGCLPAYRPTALGRQIKCAPPDAQRDTYFDTDTPPSPAQLRGRFHLTWIADHGRGRGRRVEATLWLDVHPRAPAPAVYGALVDTSTAQLDALERLGLHRARALADASPSQPGFEARLLADRLFHFYGLGGTSMGDGPFAEILVEEFRSPNEWRGRWRSWNYFSADRTGGYVCAKRVGA